MRDEYPSKAPLREIVYRWRPVRGRNFVNVKLECGHASTISRSSYPQRSRCWTCLQDEQHRWKARHTCEHGVTDDMVCKDCRIEELEAKVAELGLRGTEVIVRRGGHEGAGPGQFRDVNALYLEECDGQVHCVLIQDDPDAVVEPKRVGESGWWGKSVIRRKNESKGD